MPCDIFAQPLKATVCGYRHCYATMCSLAVFPLNSPSVPMIQSEYEAQTPNVKPHFHGQFTRWQTPYASARQIDQWLAV